MRNGFKLTLMVAIALMGMRASAMVPVINPIPDPIVGDSDGSTGTGEFVYPDAFVLSGDDPDDGPNATLTWSYDSADDTYTFNGVARLNGASPINPANTIDDTDDDPAAVDANPLSVTIRNASMSPIGGPNVDDSGIPAGIIDSETRVVTLYASDGATAGSREIVVYTDNEGEDRLSFDELFVDGDTFDTGPGDWAFAGSAGVTSSSSGGELCITVPATGDNDAYWYTPYGQVDLVDDAVYIGRFKLNTTQTTVGNVPLVVLLYDNADETDVFAGMNAYFSENYFLDNFQGANAPAGAPNGHEDFMTLFTPMAVSTQQWKDGAFTGDNANLKDARIRFRILDIGSSGYNANGDSGSVCLDEYQITRVDIGVFQRTATSFSTDTLTAANFHLAEIGGTSAVYSGGNVTLQPADGNWEGEAAVYSPGDGVMDIFASTGIADDYPVAWESDGMMFEVSMHLSAPSAAAADNPPDVLRIGLDAPTNEYIGLSWLTPAGGVAGGPIGTPVAGTPQEYRGFFAPNATTLADTGEFAIPDADRLRPRFDVLADPGLGFNGIAGNVNAGGVTVHDIAVYEVTY